MTEVFYKGDSDDRTTRLPRNRLLNCVPKDLLKAQEERARRKLDRSGKLEGESGLFEAIKEQEDLSSGGGAQLEHAMDELLKSIQGRLQTVIEFQRAKESLFLLEHLESREFSTVERMLRNAVENGDEWKPRPEKPAVDVARSYLLNLDFYGVEAARVARIPDGGLGITVKCGSREAYADAYNDGELVVALLGNRRAKEVESKKPSLRVAQMIKSWIQGK